MDYTDEAAVWAMLTAPMTVVKGDGRTQVRIRKEPDSKSAAIGILTRATQGIRVIETLDNGWSLIECYSSSFADNTVKAWNLLVQGYVETNTLTTVEWDSNDKYGLVVDKLTQRLYIYEDGHLISTLLVSTGLANAKQPFNETRSGEYIIGSFTGEFTSGNLYCGMGLRYNDGDLLHEVPHTKRADGSKSYAYNEPKLGTRASHGCIRAQARRHHAEVAPAQRHVIHVERFVGHGIADLKIPDRSARNMPPASGGERTGRNGSDRIPHRTLSPPPKRLSAPFGDAPSRHRAPVKRTASGVRRGCGIRGA